jgi:hypothetical protein
MPVDGFQFRFSGKILKIPTNVRAQAETWFRNGLSQVLVRRRSQGVLVTHGEAPASKTVLNIEKRLTRS